MKKQGLHLWVVTAIVTYLGMKREEVVVGKRKKIREEATMVNLEACIAGVYGLDVVGHGRCSIQRRGLESGNGGFLPKSSPSLSSSHSPSFFYPYKVDKERRINGW